VEPDGEELTNVVSKIPGPAHCWAEVVDD
jgi:hypothetical protein